MRAYLRTGARLATRAMLVVSAMACLTPDAATAGEGWWGGLDEGKAVSLADVLAQPNDHREKTLTFAAIFHGRDDVFDWQRTIFNRKNYGNVTFWPDGAPLWEQSAFERDHPFFYISKTHRQYSELMQVKTYTRLQVTAKIRSFSRGRPAFEILAFQPTGHRFGRRAVEGVLRGDNFARLDGASNLELAARSYRDVLEAFPDLPTTYDLQVRRRLAHVLRELGYDDKAARVEGGAPILSSRPLPGPRDGQRAVRPRTPAAATGAGPTAGDGWGSPDGMPPAGNAPAVRSNDDGWGSPDGAPPAGNDDATGSPDGMASGGYGSTDLPPEGLPPMTGPGDGLGMPAGMDDDLPGAPIFDAPSVDDPAPNGSTSPVRPRATRQPRMPQPGSQQPGTRRRVTNGPNGRRPTPTGTPRGGQRQGNAVALPGIPPSRTPRLSGVK